jgi:hypothetical protein
MAGAGLSERRPRQATSQPINDGALQVKARADVRLPPQQVDALNIDVGALRAEREGSFAVCPAWIDQSSHPGEQWAMMLSGPVDLG